MSVCIFIASNSPLREVSPSKEYPLHINVDEGTIYDGGADDNFFLLNFEDVDSYTNKKYGVVLEWRYTDGRAKKVLEYIKQALEQEDTIEIWKVWLMDYYEYDERPVIHKRTIPFSDVTVEDLKNLDGSEIWNHPDKRNPGRPSFYCLTIRNGGE